MNPLSRRDRRALMVLGAALAVIAAWWLLLTREDTAVAAVQDSAQLAGKQLTRLRQVASTVPGKEAITAKAAALVKEKEKGMLPVETAEQAQAELLKIVRAVSKEQSIDARGGEFGPVVPLGQDYGEVSVAVAFECGIEQLVNLLAGLTQRPELITTNDMQINSANPKAKTVNVRLSLAGVVPRKLVPEKKGPVAF